MTRATDVPFESLRCCPLTLLRPAWSARARSPMLDLADKTILVTGATSGIGLEASVDFASRGATVVMVGRDPERTDRAVAEVKSRAKAGDVSSLLCDFGSQRQIRALADAYRAKHARLDILVNNAGLVSPSRTLTEDGIETTFAVNHLGYFLLTNLLLDLVVKSAPSRIVNVSSEGHRRGSMDFDDLGFAKGYFIMAAYSRSKLGNVLFTRELARRLEGKNVTVNCLHPGGVATGIWAKAPKGTRTLIALLGKLFFISAHEGAQTIVYLATSPDVASVTGEYFKNNRSVKIARLGRDDALAAKLWDVSAKMTGLVS
jgi:NAD(P)-dependent dehydrogenase (short-subunit alcohol dehydrogenase family)